MENTTKKIKNIVERFGLKLKGNEFEQKISELKTSSPKYFEGSPIKRSPDAAEYIMRYMCDYLAIDIKKYSEKEEISNLPEWVGDAIKISFEDINRVISAKVNLHFFELQNWWEEQNFSGIATEEFVLECKLKGTFDKERAEFDFARHLVKRLREISWDINASTDFYKVSLELEEVIKEYWGEKVAK